MSSLRNVRNQSISQPASSHEGFVVGGRRLFGGGEVESAEDRTVTLEMVVENSGALLAEINPNCHICGAGIIPPFISLSYQ